MIPEKTLSDIAFKTKGSSFFKISSNKQFHPYELLNYIPHETVILLLSRTAKNMHQLLDQHGYDLSKTHFIDLISKTIDSPFEHKNTTYTQNIDLSDLTEIIENKIKTLKPGVKTLFIDQMDNILLHNGELKTLRFIDFLKKRMDHHQTRTIFLANNKRLTKNMSKFLFTKCDEIIEIP